MFTTCTLYGGEYELPAGPNTEDILVHELEMHVSDVRYIAARVVVGRGVWAGAKTLYTVAPQLRVAPLYSSHEYSSGYM